MFSKKQLIYDLIYFYQKMLLPFVINRQRYFQIKKEWEDNIKSFLVSSKIEIYKKLRLIARYTPDPEKYLASIIFHLEADIFHTNSDFLRENVSEADFERIFSIHAS